MTVETDIQDHIDQVTALADDYAQRADVAVQSAITAAAGWAGTNPMYAPVPNVMITGTDPSGGNYKADFANDYTATFNQLKPYLDTLKNDWLNTFFPEASQCLREHADAWLCDVISGSQVNYNGIPPAIEAAIWDRARDRDSKEAARLEDEAYNAYAQRGFTLPPGSLNATLLTLRQAEREKSVSTNREAAIKAIDVWIETIKFAVGQANQLRLGIQSALNGYLATYLGVPRIAVDKASQLVAAEAKLWDASGSYYNAVLRSAELTSRVEMFNKEVNLRAQDIDVKAFQARTIAQVKAALAGAQYLANAAAGALSSLNTLSQLGKNEEV